MQVVLACLQLVCFRKEVSWKLMSGSKLSDLQLYFAGVFEGLGHIFLICFKKIIKILKIRKIFRRVTFYEYLFVNDKSCYQLVVATRITNITNSLTMISMRFKWYHFYIGLVCQNCFAHSVLVLMALSMGLSNFVKGPIRSNTIQ